LPTPKRLQSPASKTYPNASLVAACCENLSLTQIRERIKAALPVKEEPQSLKNKIKETSGRLQKARFWDNPQKQKQLEKLLAQMEALLADE